MKKILVTGNLGYVGSELTKYINTHHDNVYIIGYDSGYFKSLVTDGSSSDSNYVDKQVIGDIRSLNPGILDGIDSVIHLAAVSNDPIGKMFSKATHDINFQASIQLLHNSIKAGVSNFVFASSCSVYGLESNSPRTEEDEVNPLTSYAKSKVDTEFKATEIAKNNILFTSLRFATACGWSRRLRLDLVLNDFVYRALTENKITVLSDGTPWRPLIDVADMSKALFWAANRTLPADNNTAILNVGSTNSNYQVRELAEKVKEQLNTVEININESASPDKRSYKVNFDKYCNLSGNCINNIDIDTTINKLIYYIRDNIKYIESISKYKRLTTLKEMVDNNYLNSQLIKTDNI